MIMVEDIIFLYICGAIFLLIGIYAIVNGIVLIVNSHRDVKRLEEFVNKYDKK